MHNSPETTAIRQRMEEVRCELDEDVQEIVEGARSVGDWRSNVRTYPWVCLGAAAAVGYLIVPRHPRGLQSETQTLAELANQSRLPATLPLPPPGGTRNMLLGLVGNLIMRGITAYVEQQAGKLFAQQSARPPQDDQHEHPHS
jgi:hypothetical protein